MDQKGKLYIKLAIVILLMVAGISLVGKIMYSSSGNKPFQKEVDLCVQAFNKRDYSAAIQHLNNAAAFTPSANREAEYDKFIRSERSNINVLDAISEWLDHPVVEITEWSFQAGKNYRDRYPAGFKDGKPDPTLAVHRNGHFIYKDTKNDMTSFNGRPQKGMFIKEGDALWILESNLGSYEEINGIRLNNVIGTFPPEKSGEWFTISNIENHGALCRVRIVYPNARSVGNFISARYNE